MKKKVLFVLALLVIAGAVFAQAPTLDKLSFVLGTGNNQGYVVRAANNNISGAVVIPDTYQGTSVTLMAADAFMNCTGITSVTILGNSLTGLNNRTFRGCTNLESVTFPASLNSMGLTATFEGCTNLTSVTFQGTIRQANFSASSTRDIGDLRDKYLAAGGGPGTYTRQKGGTVWTKQGGADGIVCPHCGQLIPGAVWR